MTAAHNIDFVKMKEEIASDNASLQTDTSPENLARIKKNTSERAILFRAGYTKEMNADLDRVAAFKDNESLETSLKSYDISDYMPGDVLDPETFSKYNMVLAAIKRLKNDYAEEQKILKMISELRFQKGKSVSEEHQVIKHLRSAYKNKTAKNYVDYFSSDIGRSDVRDSILRDKLLKMRNDVDPVQQQAIDTLGL